MGGLKMKTIGLLGGMSWESSAVYYRLINEGVRERLGGMHSAPCVLVSVDFAQTHRMQMAGEWSEVGGVLAGGLRGLAAAGADFCVLCTNTMHKLAPMLEREGVLPLLHIADATAEAVRAAGVRRVGLLGTRFTMEETFYTDRLLGQGLEVVVPEETDRAEVNRVIFEELVQGKLLASSRRTYGEIISRLVDEGAQGVILGCTEIGLVIEEGDASIPLFDTTRIHATAAVTRALEGADSRIEP